MVTNNVGSSFLRLFIYGFVLALAVGDAAYGMKRRHPGDGEGEGKCPRVETLSVPLHQTKLVATDDDCDVTYAILSPDCMFLAFGDVGGCVAIYDTCNGSLKERLIRLDFRVTLLKWSSDSKFLLAYACQDGVVGFPLLVIWEKQENNKFAPVNTIDDEHRLIVDFAIGNTLDSLVYGTQESLFLPKFDPEEGISLKFFADHDEGENLSFDAVKTSPEGRYVISVYSSCLGQDQSSVTFFERCRQDNDDKFKKVSSLEMLEKCLACDIAQNGDILVLTKTAI